MDLYGSGCDGSFKSVVSFGGVGDTFGFSPNRESGARKMRGADWGDLRAWRDLRIKGDRIVREMG